MDTPGSVSAWINSVWLDPAHEKRNEDENEGDHGQDDTHGQHGDGAVRVFPVLDHGEHARDETQYNQGQQYGDDDFGE